MNEVLVESRKARLGAAVFTVGLLIAVGYGLCRWVEPVRPFLTHVTVGLGLLGSCLWLARWVQHLQDKTEDQVLHFFWNPGFWGTCVLLAAALTFVSVSLTIPRPQSVLARSEEPLHQPAVEFPLLKVSGVTLNGSHSTAVIGRQIVGVGDFVDALKVVKIFDEGVVMEAGGERRIYYRNVTRPVLPTDGNVVCYHQDCPGNH